MFKISALSNNPWSVEKYKGGGYLRFMCPNLWSFQTRCSSHPCWKTYKLLSKYIHNTQSDPNLLYGDVDNKGTVVKDEQRKQDGTNVVSDTTLRPLPISSKLGPNSRTAGLLSEEDYDRLITDVIEWLKTKCRSTGWLWFGAKSWSLSKTIDIATIRGMVLHLWSSQSFLESPFGFVGLNGLLLLLLPCILQPRLSMGLHIRKYFMLFANFGTLVLHGSIQVNL